MHPAANLIAIILTAAACGWLTGAAELGPFLSLAAGMIVTGSVALILPWRA